MTTTARAARDEAMGRVEENADEVWMQEARQALWETIKRIGTGGTFTTDDIDCSTPHEPRAWGPIMLKAARARVIEKTGAMRESNSARCHARPKALWRVTYQLPTNDEPRVNGAQAHSTQEGVVAP